MYTGRVVDHNKIIICEAVNIDGKQKVNSTEKSLYIQCRYYLSYSVQFLFILSNRYISYICDFHFIFHFKMESCPVSIALTLVLIICSVLCIIITICNYTMYVFNWM